MVSDNATYFISQYQDLNTFVNVCFITHKLASTYHPATNGQALMFAPTIKTFYRR